MQPESVNSRIEEIVWRHVTEPQSLLVNHLLYRRPSSATDKLREQIVLPVHGIASELGSGACCVFFCCFFANKLNLHNNAICVNTHCRFCVCRQIQRDVLHVFHTCIDLFLVVK